MAYANANVYRESPTRFLHDACMTPDRHPERFVYPLAKYGDDTPFQADPWCWWPVYSLNPETAPACEDCGLPVLGLG